jgi:glycosyltransferase involved in cell wall biosynthesis
MTAGPTACRELGVERDVAVPEFVPNGTAYLAHAGVVALSSLWENIPTVRIEALALGAPVVENGAAR